jgi:dTDP-4-dehydrorhamnose 3,5-epimerase
MEMMENHEFREFIEWHMRHSEIPRCPEILSALGEIGYRPHATAEIHHPGPALDRAILSDAVADRSVGSHRLAWHSDARGALIEVVRASEVGSIAQVYLSATRPGVVKGWHLHLRQTDRFFVVRGRVIVAVCPIPIRIDHRQIWQGSTPERFSRAEPMPVISEFLLDAERAPIRVTIPPGYAHGWMALGSEEAWVLNAVSHEYDGMDEYRRDAHSGPFEGVPYDWRRSRDG